MKLTKPVLCQRSFYPLYPPNEEVNLDMDQLENIGTSFDVKPDIMILPSDLLHFFKVRVQIQALPLSLNKLLANSSPLNSNQFKLQDIEGTLAMNPQRLSRGEGGGVFARLKVTPTENDSDNKKHTISAEIIRI